MSQIKTTCTNLTTLLHKIRERKEAIDGPVEEDLIADAMLLFAQLSGQHSRLMREADMEYEKIHEVCESLRCLIFITGEINVLFGHTSIINRTR